MTIRKKGRFADKGKAILGDKKPSALGEILDDTPSPSPEEKKQTAKQRRTAPKKPQASGTAEAKRVSEKDARKTVNASPDELPPKREEFRLPGSLAERLRVYVFDTRTKKTAVVIEALNAHLTKKGY